MKILRFVMIICVGLCVGILPVYGMASLHPISLYEKGQALIQRYDGEIGVIVAAQDIFIQLITKYPNSPFGYLGMSQIYRIDAQIDNENYDLELIRTQALPFALKALQLGPSIRAVHENYAFFEQFFQTNQYMK